MRPDGSGPLVHIYYLIYKYVLLYYTQGRRWPAVMPSSHGPKKKKKEEVAGNYYITLYENHSSVFGSCAMFDHGNQCCTQETNSLLPFALDCRPATPCKEIKTCTYKYIRPMRGRAFDVVLPLQVADA